MASMSCRRCGQPAANCGRSDTRAMSCDIQIIPYFTKCAIVPCCFEEKIKELGDNWLVAQTSGDHLFDFSVLKTESRTFLCGPFWMSFLAHHDIGLGDVVKLECVEVDEMEEENIQNASPAKVYVSVTDGAGNNKPYIPLGGYPLFEVPSCVRATLHKTVFADIWSVDERSMSDIIWEIYKEVGRFYEGEFYHVPDLQYYVKKLYAVDVAPHVLSIPKGLFRGFSYPSDGNVLYWNKVMDEHIWGNYRLHRSRIKLRTGFHTLCNVLELVPGDVILVKIEVREAGIALEVEKIAV